MIHWNNNTNRMCAPSFGDFLLWSLELKFLVLGLGQGRGNSTTKCIMRWIRVMPVIVKKESTEWDWDKRGVEGSSMWRRTKGRSWNSESICSFDKYSLSYCLYVWHCSRPWWHYGKKTKNKKHLPYWVYSLVRKIRNGKWLEQRCSHGTLAWNERKVNYV